jgi:hypothetical protein
MRFAMAITFEQAATAARAYLEREPFPHPGYRWVLPPGRPVPDGWYFDFTFERTDGQPLSDADAMGGAPGFLVSATDGQIKTIAMGGHI